MGLVKTARGWSDRVSSDNALCGALGEDHAGRPAANWLFECLNGTLSGQYVTIQKIPGERTTLYLTEAYVDTEEEVADGSMVQGEGDMQRGDMLFGVMYMYVRKISSPYKHIFDVKLLTAVQWCQQWTLLGLRSNIRMPVLKS